MELYYDGQLAKTDPKEIGVQVRKRKLENSNVEPGEPKPKSEYQHQPDSGFPKLQVDEKPVSDVWKMSLAYNLDVHYRQTPESKSQEHLDYCATSEIWKLYQDLMPGKSESETPEKEDFKMEVLRSAGETKMATDHLMEIMSEIEPQTSRKQPLAIDHVFPDLGNICGEDDGQRAAMKLEKILECMESSPVDETSSESHPERQELQAIQSVKSEGILVKTRGEAVDSRSDVKWETALEK